MRSGSRLRKKHKKLDAINEEYNRNHGEINEGDVVSDGYGDAGVRRSSRVRRAPVLLDASPAPPKKRRTLGENGALKGLKDGKSVGRVTKSSGGVDDPGTWSLRLRSRDRNVGFEVKEKKGSSSVKRKLLEDGDEDAEVDKKDELESRRKPKIVKSKRPGRIKATNHEQRMKDKENETREDVDESKSQEEELTSNKDEENETHEDLDESKSQEVELTLNKDEESETHENLVESKSQEVEPTLNNDEENETHGNLDESESQEMELTYNKDEEGASVLKETQLSGGNVERDISNNVQIEGCNGSIEPTPEELVDEQVDQLENSKEGKIASDVAEDAGIPEKQVQNEGSVGEEVDINKESFQDENIVRVDLSKQASNDKPRHQRIKEGRRCGLCGGGTDSTKPPKRLVQDNGESDNEAYSGSSASEEPNYDIWDGFGDESGWLGRLLGPINDRYGIAGIWVHQQCAVWSPEVYFAGLGCLKNVRSTLCRGRALKCKRCGRRGATIGCRVDRCPKTYHLVGYIFCRE